MKHRWHVWPQLRAGRGSSWRPGPSPPGSPSRQTAPAAAPWRPASGRGARTATGWGQFVVSLLLFYSYKISIYIICRPMPVRWCRLEASEWLQGNHYEVWEPSLLTVTAPQGAESISVLTPIEKCYGDRFIAMFYQHVEYCGENS